MKLLSIFLLFVFCNVDQTQKKFAVNGKITYTSAYCGGVEPSPETMLALQTPKAFSTMLYVRQGSVNNEHSKIIDSIQTNEKGEFSFKLKKGNYVIFLHQQKTKDWIHSMKKNESVSLKVKEECLNSWWEKGVFQVEVTSNDIVNLNYNIYQECFTPNPASCFDYRGPYPP